MYYLCILSDRGLNFEFCFQQIPEAPESAELLEILKTQTWSTYVLITTRLFCKKDQE